jgi:multidrug resistance efflux pump
MTQPARLQKTPTVSFIATSCSMSAGLISGQAFDAARADYNSARSNYAIKERAVAVARAQLALAERNDEDMIIRAPFAGIVTVKAAQPGEIVSPLSASSGFARTGIGTIVDMDSMEVEVDVSENFIARVHPGQKAVVRLNAYPDLDIAAETVAVIPCRGPFEGLHQGSRRPPGERPEDPARHGRQSDFSQSTESGGVQ